MLAGVLRGGEDRVAAAGLDSKNGIDGWCSGRYTETLGIWRSGGW